jgi:hypothetical protein
LKKALVLAGLMLLVALPASAASDFRTVYDNKTGNITQAIDNDNWQKASDLSTDWIGQLGGWDGTYPTDVDDANCSHEYDDLMTASGAYAVGGRAVGQSKGDPGLLGTILWAGGMTEGAATREGIDTCILDAAVVETEPEGGTAPSPAPEA